MLRRWHKRRWNEVLVDHQVSWRGWRIPWRLVIFEEGIPKSLVKWLFLINLYLVWLSISFFFWNAEGDGRGISNALQNFWKNIFLDFFTCSLRLMGALRMLTGALVAQLAGENRCILAWSENESQPGAPCCAPFFHAAQVPGRRFRGRKFLVASSVDFFLSEESAVTVELASELVGESELVAEQAFAFLGCFSLDCRALVWWFQIVWSALVEICSFFLINFTDLQQNNFNQILVTYLYWFLSRWNQLLMKGRGRSRSREIASFS